MSSLTFYFLLSHLKNNFREMDTNKDGFVDFEELQNGFKDHGIEYEGDLKQFLDKVDTNHDGKLSFSEIMAQAKNDVKVVE